ncbi:peroxidase 5-like isoform X1 [Nymphaea colorata]|nr:peroxidase 5-like isoform X1 [Nymphaea colorata]
MKGIMVPYSSTHGRLAMAGSLALFCLLMGLASVGLAHDGELRVGYYSRSCPSVEDVVRSTVAKAVASDPGMPAALIRLHFHDCFVRGCDASVLLDSTPGNPAEKDSPTNNPSLNGFDVIDAAKSTLESQCPQVVSCADIVAFAARESVRIAGGFYYPVPAGRRDGLVSKKSEVNQNLPMAFFNVKQLEENFARKGFSLEDMVTLSGAHTIGDSHCSAFSNRLYNFKNTTNASDPSMDQTYVSDLKSKCPAPGSGQDPTVSLDPVTPRTLDNQYYVNVKSHRGLLSSDQALMDRADTARMVLANINSGSMWLHKFADAMVRMGKIEVLTGSQGQIRKSCRVVN